MEKLPDKNACRYYRSVKRAAISLPAENRAGFLNELYACIMQYLESNPHPTNKDLTDTFGDPVNSVCTFVDEFGLANAVEKRKKARRITVIVSSFLLVVLLIFAGLKIWSLMRDKEVETMEVITIYPELE